MMKRYKITLPTKEQCTALGIKFEGQETRTRLWVMGFAMGVSLDKSTFNLTFANRNAIYCETDSTVAVAKLTEHLDSYGCTVEREEKSIILSPVIVSKEQWNARGVPS
jgi:hypothetical protein